MTDQTTDTSAPSQREAMTDALDYWWNFDEESGTRRTSHAWLVDIDVPGVAGIMLRRLQDQGYRIVASSAPTDASAEGLDVERLASALCTYAQIGDWLHEGIGPATAREVAANLAREYARLSPSTPEQKRRYAVEPDGKEGDM